MGVQDHVVYLGRNPPGPNDQPLAETETASVETGPLVGAATYYWRVDQRNDSGTTVGHVWQFTTGGVRADIDGDGDVDLEDFAVLQQCYSAAPVSGDCLQADLSGDGLVNQADFEIFRACLSGTDVPANPACGLSS